MNKQYLMAILILIECGCATTYGQSLIRTIPPGAQLEVEGQKIGRTPALLEYNWYSSSFKLTKEGYRPIEGELISSPKHVFSTRLGVIGGTIAGGLLTIACVILRANYTPPPDMDASKANDTTNACFLFPVAGGLIGLAVSGRPQYSLHEEYIFDLEPLGKSAEIKAPKSPETLKVEKKDTSVKELPLNEKELQGLEKGPANVPKR